MRAARTLDGTGLGLPGGLAVCGFLTMAAAVHTCLPEPRVRVQPAPAASAPVPALTAIAAPPPSPSPPPAAVLPPRAATPAPPDCPPLFSAYFASGGLRFSAPPPEELSRLRDWLAAHPAAALLIQGHTDARGGSQFNWELSYRRAHAVMQHLQKAGLPRQRMTAQAVGPFQPVAGASTAAERNRRVTLWLLGAPECAAGSQGYEAPR